MSTKTEYPKKMEARLNTWRAELAQLELKAEAMAPESRQGCFAEIQSLQELRNRMVSLLRDLRRTSDVKEGMRLETELERSESELERKFEACRDRLEPEPR